MDLVLGSSHGAHADSMFIATANSVRRWDLRRGCSVGKLHGNHQAPVMVLAAGLQQLTDEESTDHDDANCLTVVTGSKDHYIKVFRVPPDASGLLTPSIELEPPHYDGISALALHPQGLLFSASRDGAIKKWRLCPAQGRQELITSQAHKDWILGMSLTTDGSILVSGCRGGTLKLWRVEDCAFLGEVQTAHDGAINAIRIQKDRIFTASRQVVYYLYICSFFFRYCK
ncbi:unnamed protein product [Protopolystoma xenopodis]|uniref:Uncharacterized protein n=1 Tax=Protopolystoma xenopodis TaxID=117903 RepID=A0A3S5C4J7_9PLAT|nr:unnamed protein product [Protopolystoma xenopodis]